MGCSAVLKSSLLCFRLTLIQWADIVSQFPILKSTHHLLPSPYGELAPAIEAVLDIYGVNVTVVVAHNGQGSPRPSMF